MWWDECGGRRPTLGPIGVSCDATAIVGKERGIWVWGEKNWINFCKYCVRLLSAGNAPLQKRFGRGDLYCARPACGAPTGVRARHRIATVILHRLHRSAARRARERVPNPCRLPRCTATALSRRGRCTTASRRRRRACCQRGTCCATWTSAGRPRRDFQPRTTSAAASSGPACALRAHQRGGAPLSRHDESRFRRSDAAHRRGTASARRPAPPPSMPPPPSPAGRPLRAGSRHQACPTRSRGRPPSPPPRYAPMRVARPARAARRTRAARRRRLRHPRRRQRRRRRWRRRRRRRLRLLLRRSFGWARMSTAVQWRPSGFPSAPPPPTTS